MQDIHVDQEDNAMERRLWAYSNDFGWFAVDPSACDYDEDKVDTVAPVLEAETKHALMQKAAAENYEIVMWLE
jgi:hypothetical protein